jgi:hypothetical protein
MGAFAEKRKPTVSWTTGRITGRSESDVAEPGDVVEEDPFPLCWEYPNGLPRQRTIPVLSLSHARGERTYGTLCTIKTLYSSSFNFSLDFLEAFFYDFSEVGRNIGVKKDFVKRYHKTLTVIYSFKGRRSG